jgi:hypothetical protein
MPDAHVKLPYKEEKVMSIRPIDFNGAGLRTQDMSILKQHEDNKPVVEQVSIQTQRDKEAQEKSRKVIHADDSSNELSQYDAKDKGRNQYERMEQKNKKKERKTDKVVRKDYQGGFDVSI